MSAGTHNSNSTNGAGTADGNGAAQPPSAFDTAKSLLQPYVDFFGDGKLDGPSLLAKADEIAATCKVRSIDLRKWAKLQMDALVARPANRQPVPRSPCLADPEPDRCPAPIHNLLEAIATMVRGRVFCSPEAVDAVALWCAGTYGLYPPSDPVAGPDVYPRLLLRSPTKRCGKSTMLEVVQHTVRKPLAATDVSEAAVFRSVDKWRPTLVIDEADRLFAKNRDLVGIVNSGYCRTGHVVRTMEVRSQNVRSHEPVAFPTYAAAAIASIGRLAPTIEDRGIRVDLQRQPSGRKTQRVGLRQLARLRDKIAPHLMAHADAIGAAMAAGVPDSMMPSTLNDRDADNWRPILGLAQLAGGNWLGRAQRAATHLCKEGAVSDRENEWVLRQVVEFVNERRGAANTQWREWVQGGRKIVKPLGSHPAVRRPEICRFVASDELAVWLITKDDSGFGDLRDIEAAKLRIARVLYTFEVKPGRRRVNGKPTRGYEVAAIRALWRQYGS